LDENHDGKVSKEEFVALVRMCLEALVDKLKSKEALADEEAGEALT
jgi:hypothetical protein